MKCPRPTIASTQLCLVFTSAKDIKVKLLNKVGQSVDACAREWKIPPPQLQDFPMHLDKHLHL